MPARRAIPNPRGQLALGHALARIETNPDICANHIARAVPLRALTPLGIASDYHNRTYSLELDGLAISNGRGSPFAIEVDQQPRPSLLVSLGGSAAIEIGGKSYEHNPGQPLFFLPGENFRCSFLEAHALIMSVEPIRLARKVMTMAEQAQLDSVDLGRLQQPLVVSTDHWVTGHLSRMLHSTLQLLDLSLLKEQPIPTGSLASISDLLCSQLAGLIYPTLLNPH